MYYKYVKKRKEKPLQKLIANKQKIEISNNQEIEQKEEEHINIIKNKDDFRNICNNNLKLIRNIIIPDIPHENYYETFYIEFRIFTHAEFLIRNTILKLPNWAHTVVCGNINFENITNICNNISPNIRIIKLYRHYDSIFLYLSLGTIVCCFTNTIQLSILSLAPQLL